MEKVRDYLNKFTGKEYVFLERRGNTALKKLFNLMKNEGRKYILMQDQGGWITYRQFAEKNKMEIIRIPTDYGIIESVEDIKEAMGNRVAEECFIMINSMPGYHALQPMEGIAEWCKSEGVVVINDVSGSIGYDVAKQGDYLVGSFGKAKPLDIGGGGFIATDKNIGFEESGEIDTAALAERLSKLAEIQERFKKKHDEIISKLKGYDIVHPDSKGINVIVKGEELADVQEFCVNEGLEYTECPRYIRINEKGMCIEVKRL